MRKNDARLNKNLKKFNTITLTELNSSASFLKRIDRKYLLTTSQFLEMIWKLKNNFKVLEISGKKVFEYDNVYMDTNDYFFYKQHQNKLKSRTKVRTRYYVDSNLAYFEFKQKINWVTSKYRYDFPAEEHWFMTKGKKRFFDWVWQSMYSGTKAPQISPSIKTNYKRITMVSLDWSERLTIDFNVKTTDLRKIWWNKEVDLKNLIIIESKSLKKDSTASNIMKKFKIKKAKSCSKYSLWVVYNWLAEKFDTFKDTMEKIKEIRMDTIKKINRVQNINSFKKDKLLVKEVKNT